MIYFSDVDVVLKLAACGFLPLLAELLGVPEHEIRIQFLASLKSRLNRPSKKLENPVYQKHLESFCAAHAVIEAAGSPDRQQELLQSGMDPGEAILFAEAEATCGTVVTGDKRALMAYAKVSERRHRERIRIVCWEQLLLRVYRLRGFEALKKGACEGRASDGVLSLAFSSGLATSEEHAIEALKSYFGQIIKHSGDILFRFPE